MKTNYGISRRRSRYRDGNWKLAYPTNKVYADWMCAGSYGISMAMYHKTGAKSSGRKHQLEQTAVKLEGESLSVWLLYYQQSCHLHSFTPPDSSRNKHPFLISSTLLPPRRIYWIGRLSFTFTQKKIFWNPIHIHVHGHNQCWYIIIKPFCSTIVDARGMDQIRSDRSNQFNSQRKAVGGKTKQKLRPMLLSFFS